MILAGLCATALGLRPLSAADAKAFRSDVDFVVRSIETMYPAPFAHADKAVLAGDAASVKARRGLGCAQSMALVAERNDGHTHVLPINVPGATARYPIRFHAFPDGIHVTSVAPEYAALAGKRVLSVVALDADAAMRKAGALQAANNPPAAREGVVWLSQAAIAQAIGAAANGLAEAERAAGDIESAKTHYRKAPALNPGAADATDALAEMEKTGR